VRSPLLDRYCSRLVRLGYSDPLATHLGIELHFDSALSQVVATEKNQHHAHTGQCLFYDQKAIKVELGLGADELDW